MLPNRWSHLLRYSLLGTSLVAPSSAHAESCDEVADGTVTLLIGAQFAPELKIVGGLEGRVCINNQTEAMLRFELGGDSPRFIAGARARPFESYYREDELELLGIEGGGVIDTRAKLGVHLAATFGTHSAYLAVQAHAKVSEGEQPTQWTALGGLAPWTAFMQQTAVPGRPIAANGELLRPYVARALPVLRDAEARAVRAHFVAAAQLELSFGVDVHAARRRARCRWCAALTRGACTRCGRRRSSSRGIVRACRRRRDTRCVASRRRPSTVRDAVAACARDARDRSVVRRLPQRDRRS